MRARATIRWYMRRRSSGLASANRSCATGARTAKKNDGADGHLTQHIAEGSVVVTNDSRPRLARPRTGRPTSSLRDVSLSEETVLAKRVTP
jgi:ribose 1,5-bisphosphokinase PhnN